MFWKRFFIIFSSAYLNNCIDLKYCIAVNVYSYFKNSSKYSSPILVFCPETHSIFLYGWMVGETKKEIKVTFSSKQNKIILLQQEKLVIISRFSLSHEHIFSFGWGGGGVDARLFLPLDYPLIFTETTWSERISCLRASWLRIIIVIIPTSLRHCSLLPKILATLRS